MATASKALNPEIRAWLEADGVDPREAEIGELTIVTEVARPTEITLRLVTEEPFAVDPGRLLGQKAWLHLEWEGGRARRRAARVHAVDRMMDVRNNVYVYNVHRGSRLKGLDQRARLAIHTDASVPDAIRATLRRAGMAEGIDYEMRLRTTYPAREFIIQYQETDLAFVTRLCEHWGISFFFEQGEDRDVAVFADANVFWPRAEQGICFGVSGHRQEIFDFGARARLLPGRLILRDYNYRYPKVGLHATPELEGGSDGEIVEYGRVKIETPYKETFVQLGSPNGPEKGFLMQTNGSASFVTSLAQTYTSLLTTEESTWKAANYFVQISKAKVEKEASLNWYEKARKKYDKFRKSAELVSSTAEGFATQVNGWWAAVNDMNADALKDRGSRLFPEEGARFVAYKDATTAYVTDPAWHFPQSRTAILVFDEDYVDYALMDERDRTPRQNDLVRQVEEATSQSPLRELRELNRAFATW